MLPSAMSEINAQSCAVTSSLPSIPTAKICGTNPSVEAVYQFPENVFLLLNGITAGVFSLFVKYATTRFFDGSAIIRVPVKP